MILHFRLTFKKNNFQIKNEHHKIYNLLLFLQGRHFKFSWIDFEFDPFRRQVSANSG